MGWILQINMENGSIFNEGNYSTKKLWYMTSFVICNMIQVIVKIILGFHTTTNQYKCEEAEKFRVFRNKN